MKIVDSWLSTQAHLSMHIFGTRLKDLGLTLGNWETLWLLETETAHVTTEKTKFYKNQKNEILWIKKKVKWPLTGSFTVNLSIQTL